MCYNAVMTTKQITELERALLIELDSDRADWDKVQELQEKILEQKIPEALIKKLAKNVEDINKKIREQNLIASEILEICDNQRMVKVISRLVKPREVFHY